MKSKWKSASLKIVVSINENVNAIFTHQFIIRWYYCSVSWKVVPLTNSSFSMFTPTATSIALITAS